MIFQRIIEMTIKPPFKYFLIKQGYCGNVPKEMCFNSLSNAKITAEKLFLETKIPISIYKVYYVSESDSRQEWLCDKILTLNNYSEWITEFDDFVIHVAFLWRYDVREWNPKLYDKINKAWISHESDVLLNDDWNSVKKILGIDDLKSKTDDFKKDVERLSKKILKKFDDFVLANDELTMLVQKKYPMIRAEYSVFDRMIMFYEEDEINHIDKEFQSLKEVEEYYNEKNRSV